MISRKHIASLALAATLLSGCVVADGVGSAGFHGHHPSGEMHREHFDMHRAGENRMQEHRQRIETRSSPRTPHGAQPRANGATHAPI